MRSDANPWAALGASRRARPLERLVEAGIALVSLSAIVVIFLIFLFVGREALPVLLGQVSTARVTKLIPPADLEKLSRPELLEYLELTPKQLAALDQDSLRDLMAIKMETAAERAPDPESALNTAGWPMLLQAYRWKGLDQAEYIWQPVSAIHKYNLIPLLIGSLKTTLVALVFAVPLALGAAIYVSQLAPPSLKEWLKPGVELLSSLPSVVLGFFGLVILASLLQRWFGYASRLNAFVAGIALGLAVIPVIFSIAEDALTSVPRTYTEAALALGSTRWDAAWNIVLPAAMPGVLAAVILGFGRAIGETMVVLMASGNASIVSWSLLDSTRSMTATIAAELAETVFGGHHYRILFLIGSILFVLTFFANMAAGAVIDGLKRRLEGR